jgi:ABC-2 type transport system permease protein
VRPFFYQLRNELWKLFGKKRTYIGFGAILLAEAAIILLLRYTHGPRRDLVRRLELMGYPADQFLSNLTMAMAMMVPVAYLLMPLYVALIGGDLVAKEAEDGTLRMILSRPVSRLRLVSTKWLAGALFSIVLVLVLGASGVAFASIFFPPGSMFALLPIEGVFGLFDPGQGTIRYTTAIALLGIKAITVMGMGWMFSCFNMKPAAATILALSVFMVSRLIQEIPYFHDLQGWFITYHLNFWMRVFMQTIPWPEMCQSLSILFGYNLTFFIIGSVAFQVRDIKG